MSDWYVLSQIFPSVLLKLCPSIKFYTTLLSLLSPVELGKAFIFAILSRVKSLPSPSNISIPFKPMKFWSPQVSWSKNTKKLPYGIYGGSYYQHCLFGSFISFCFFDDEMVCWFYFDGFLFSEFRVLGRLKLIRVDLKRSFYVLALFLSSVSQSFSLIAFIIFVSLVKIMASKCLWKFYGVD